MRRLFVALRPPPDVREALLATMSGIEGARWQADNQLHLTLAFLGELDRHLCQAAADALSLIRSPALNLRLGLPGTFDAARPGRTGTLWIGVEDDPDPQIPRLPGLDPGPSSNRLPELDPGPRFFPTLSTLAQSIRTHLRRADLPPDPRKFTPHITMARFGSAGASREAIRPWLTHSSPPPLPWQATQFHLVESHLGTTGSHYEPLASFPLS